MEIERTFVCIKVLVLFFYYPRLIFSFLYFNPDNLGLYSNCVCLCVYLDTGGTHKIPSQRNFRKVTDLRR